MPDETTTTQPDGAVNQPEEQNQSTETKAAPITLTQAELDAKITGAKSQAQRNAVEAYLKGLGMTKAEAEALMKAHVTERDSKDDVAAKAQKERDDALAQLTALRIDHAVQAAAMAAGFIDPADASALIDRAQVTIGDDGVTGAKEAVEALAKAKPHLVKPKTAPPAGGGANPGADGKKTENFGAQLGMKHVASDKRAAEAAKAFGG